MYDCIMLVTVTVVIIANKPCFLQHRKTAVCNPVYNFISIIFQLSECCGLYSVEDALLL